MWSLISIKVPGYDLATFDPSPYFLSHKHDKWKYISVALFVSCLLFSLDYALHKIRDWAAYLLSSTLPQLLQHLHVQEMRLLVFNVSMEQKMSFCYVRGLPLTLLGWIFFKNNSITALDREERGRGWGKHKCETSAPEREQVKIYP